MTRLTPLTRAELDDGQGSLWDDITQIRDVKAPESDVLMGPYDAFVRVPELGRHVWSFGAHVRDPENEPRLIEIAICTVGAHWRSDFEFWAHAKNAIQHGVDPAILEAIRDGRTPTFENDDERVVHAVTSQLLDQKRVDDDTYAAGVALLGETGMIRLCAVIGYYCSISMILNLFEVALPAGVEAIWPR
jgi:4-carboxymuconolactone decarboxylase